MKPTEKKLLNIFRSLPETAQQSVIDHAEFMQQKHGTVDETATITEPLDIPRPENETVIAAVKRLSETYPMIEKSHLLDKTSLLVTEHVMQGRDVVEVIDELEELFLSKFREL